MTSIHDHVLIWRGAILAIILIISAVTDLRTRKIYNWVTFPGILAGIVINAVASGGSGILTSFEGIAVGTVWILLILLGGSKFGDLKLMYVVGAFMGPKFAAYAMIYTTVVGGVLGILFLLFRGGWSLLQYTVKNAIVGAHVFQMTQSQQGLEGMTARSKAGYMAYGPAIAIGSLIAWISLRYAM